MHTSIYSIAERLAVTEPPQHRRVLAQRYEQHITIDVPHGARPAPAAIPLGPIGSTGEMTS